MNSEVPAVLMLEDGRVYRGTAFGATGTAFGEAVFTTGMTGYQETLTDPSYRRQVVVATAPQIGNTGWVAGDGPSVGNGPENPSDNESAAIWVAGFVIRDLAPRPSNWRSTSTLPLHLLRQRAGRPPVRRARGQVPDDEAGHPDRRGLVVRRVLRPVADRRTVTGHPAGVADLRRRRDHHLTAVGRVGERLLVAGHPGGEHRLAERRAGGAERRAAVDPPVLQHQHGGYLGVHAGAPLPLGAPPSSRTGASGWSISGWSVSGWSPARSTPLVGAISARAAVIQSACSAGSSALKPLSSSTSPSRQLTISTPFGRPITLPAIPGAVPTAVSDPAGRKKASSSIRSISTPSAVSSAVAFARLPSPCATIRSCQLPAVVVQTYRPVNGVASAGPKSSGTEGNSGRPACRCARCRQPTSSPYPASTHTARIANDNQKRSTAQPPTNAAAETVARPRR